MPRPEKPRTRLGSAASLSRSKDFLPRYRRRHVSQLDELDPFLPTFSPVLFLRPTAVDRSRPWQLSEYFPRELHMVAARPLVPS